MFDNISYNDNDEPDLSSKSLADSLELSSGLTFTSWNEFKN